MVLLSRYLVSSNLVRMSVSRRKERRKEGRVTEEPRARDEKRGRAEASRERRRQMAPRKQRLGGEKKH